VHIAYCFDESYAEHAGTSVYSLLKNAARRDLLNIHLVSSALTEATQEKFRRLGAQFDIRFRHYDVAAISDSLSKLQNYQYVSNIGWTRLFLPLLLEDSIERVIYIDSDTVVLHDLSDLFHTELDQCPVGGVIDFSAQELQKRLGVGTYINSGVLLMDLSEWRKRNLTAELLDFALSNLKKFYFGDQCAINLYFEKNKKLLDSRWNTFCASGYSMTPGEISQAKILHFITGVKPWHSWFDHELEPLYWKFRQETPFKGSPVSPSNCDEAWKLARLKTKRGELQAAIDIYDRILKRFAGEPVDLDTKSP